MEKLSQLLWGAPMMVLLLLAGLYLTVRTGFVQMRLPAAVRQMVKSARSADRSGFRAVCTALAASVGTGNIAGVAGAIALGGPGAVFWMWVAAAVGMATKYAEIVLAMRFRGPDGTGGPMYYIVRAVGEKRRWLATLFAFAAVLASVAMGNMTQVHTIASAAVTALPRIPARWTTLAVGVAAALLIGVVTLGGAERLGKWMEKLMPVTAGLYIAAMAAVIAVHWKNMGIVLESILLGAFSPQAVVGAGAGIGLRQAVRWGVSRGVFSNEAGLGSAPIAHADAAAPPQQQGLLGIFEVFFDTIVLCSLTAFAILSSGIEIGYGAAAGAELVVHAWETVLGRGAAGCCTVVLALLAMATVLSWQLYGLRCARYLWGAAGGRGYAVCYMAAAVLGATAELTWVWSAADVCNGLMCLPNLIALMLLGKYVKSDWKTVSFRA